MRTALPDLLLTDTTFWVSAVRHDNQLGVSPFILVLTSSQHPTIALLSQHATSTVYLLVILVPTINLSTIKSIASLPTMCDDVINTSVLSGTCQSALAHDPVQ